MASPKQIEANKRNALRSRGPATAAGRRISSKNALKHGLTAKEITVAGEKPAELENLHAEFTEAWNPSDGMEADLVRQITFAAWRLRRIRRIEAQLFNTETAGLAMDQHVNGSARAMEMYAVATGPNAPKGQEWLELQVTTMDFMAAHMLRIGQTHKNNSEAGRHVGAVFRRLTDNQNAITQLLRYEASAERSYYRAVFALERLQANRKSTDEPATPMTEADTDGQK